MNDSLTVEKGSHKDAAITFLRLCASGKVSEAYDTYVSNRFHHHNPFFQGDAKSLAEGMEENARQYPRKTLEIVQALQDGDRVAVLSRVRMTPDGQDIALAHAFRFEGERIVELWDVAQPVPEDAVNEYGMF